MSDQHGHDDWFRHGSDEALPQEEHAAHVNTTAIGLTLLAIVFGVLLTIVLLSMYFVQYAGTRKAEMNEGTGSAEAYLAYRDQSEAILGSSGWVDRTAGTVNVSLDDAMDAVVSDYAEWADEARGEWIGPKAPARTASASGDHASQHAGDYDAHATGDSNHEQEQTHSDG